MVSVFELFDPKHQPRVFRLESDDADAMRTHVLEAADNGASHRAIDYFVFRVQRELGAMAAAMGGLDALVFCGGIGERVRRPACLKARVQARSPDVPIRNRQRGRFRAPPLLYHRDGASWHLASPPDYS